MNSSRAKWAHDQKLNFGKIKEVLTGLKCTLETKVTEERKKLDKYQRILTKTQR